MLPELTSANRSPRHEIGTDRAGSSAGQNVVYSAPRRLRSLSRAAGSLTSGQPITPANRSKLALPYHVLCVPIEICGAAATPASAPPASAAAGPAPATGTIAASTAAIRLTGPTIALPDVTVVARSATARDECAGGRRQRGAV